MITQLRGSRDSIAEVGRKALGHLTHMVAERRRWVSALLLLAVFTGSMADAEGDNRFDMEALARVGEFSGERSEWKKWSLIFVWLCTVSKRRRWRSSTRTSTQRRSGSIASSIMCWHWCFVVRPWTS